MNQLAAFETRKSESGKLKAPIGKRKSKSENGKTKVENEESQITHHKSPITNRKSKITLWRDRPMTPSLRMTANLALGAGMSGSGSLIGGDLARQPALEFLSFPAEL